MIPRDDIRGVLILLPAFMALLFAAELWARLGSPKPETTRKLVHIGGGVLCAFFPFLFQSPLTVLAVTLGLAALLTLGARIRLFHSMHRVERRTRGSEYFPLAVLAVFILSDGRPWLYMSSVLVLTVADAAAALVGTRYGRIRYEVDTASKSLEGSLAFLALAFLAILIPCAWLSGLPWIVCMLAALLVSVLVTGFEAISLRGSDNLFVPIGVCVILGKITAQPLGEILFQLASMALIGLIVVLLVRRSRSFNTGGTIVFALFLYGAWSLGSPYWALPLLVAFAIYMLAWFLWPLAPVKSPVVLRALLIPLLLLVLANSTRDGLRWFGPYLAACVTLASLALWNHLLQIRSWTRRGRAAAAAAVATFIWLTAAGAPWLIGVGIPRDAFLGVGVLTVLAALLHDRWLGAHPDFEGEHIWSPLRFLLTAAAAATLIVLQAAGFVRYWPPCDRCPPLERSTAAPSPSLALRSCGPAVRL